MEKKYLCPYCFNELSVNDVLFQCRNHPDKLIAWDGNSRKAKCSICGVETGMLVCKHCKKKRELPPATFENKNIIITVIGSRSAGKSMFMGVLLKELRDRIAPAFDGSIQNANEENKWIDTYANQIYKGEHTTVAQTSLLENQEPLIYKLRLPHTPWWKKLFNIEPKPNEHLVYTFCFFDTAGEAFNSESNMERVKNYINHSTGIIYLVDPFAIPAVRNTVAQDVQDGSYQRGNYNEVEDTAGLISRVAKFIRINKEISENKPIETPIAVTFSKFDAIPRQLIPNDFRINEPSPHCASQAFVKQDGNAVNEEIKALLNDWDQKNFLANIRFNFTNAAFFGVSALGLNNYPKKKEGTNNFTFNRPHPHRIEDPLLWLLQEQGIIKAK